MLIGALKKREVNMAGRSTKAIINSPKTDRTKQHHSSRSRSRLSPNRSHLKRSRTYSGRKQSGARISHNRLRKVLEDLAVTCENIREALQSFWIIPESDIRQTLGKTQRTIGKAVEMLPRAA
jgi:hypothetical protein